MGRRSIRGTTGSVRLAAGLVLATAWTSPVPAFEIPSVWTSEHFADHPLVGSLVDGHGRAADMAALDTDVAAARYVLVGEIHTNADHHLIQARIAAGIAARRPALVFEMISTDLEPQLSAFLAASEQTAEGLGEATNWQERGWPDIAIYRPIIDVAVEAGLAIVPGDLPRETIRRIGREGSGALPAGEAERLGLDRPMPAPQAAELAETLKTSHCGMLPEPAIAGMATAQRARDGALADAMRTAAAEAGAALLIAGAGHVRADFAVPALLAGREPEAGIVSIALMEVADGEETPADYGLSADAPALYDYVVFTPRDDIADPCEGMAEAMGKMRTAPD